MALPALVNGAECGPVNPLQSLSKQFDKDRGVQQDQFGYQRAGSSREVFRTQSSAHHPALTQEAAQFFSGPSGLSGFSQQHATSLDLSSLRDNLPQPSQAPYISSVEAKHVSPWATDFLNQPLMSPSLQTHVFEQKLGALDSHAIQPTQPYIPHMNRGFIPSTFRPLLPAPPIHQPLPFGLTQPHSENIILEEHFPKEEHAPQEQTQPYTSTVDADELSRTAGLLIDSVKRETNPKFKNSAFLGLMRQLRDRKVVIEGTEMVEVDGGAVGWAQDFASSSDIKGKAKAEGEAGWRLLESEEETNVGLSSSMSRQSPPARDQSLGRKTVHFGHSVVLDNTSSTEVKSSAETENSAEEEYWRQENADYQAYWNNVSGQPTTRRSDPEWDILQQDWDRFEATATGIKPVPYYQFQSRNPYLTGASSTRVHKVHTQGLHSNESILELEAAVQQDIRNPRLWFQLGAKQQENEREVHAIRALQRAVELDPSYLEAWLALAISYTNEGDRAGAYKAIEHWVRNNKRYDATSILAAMNHGTQSTDSENHEALVHCLMSMARIAPDGEVDADIQTALGVLLNTNEDYQKAQDCFQAALSVRPDDGVLYNRVGATLANSGRAADAIWYYHQALALNPSYIRARFNLGISCINMKQYDEAAQHILDALILQKQETSDNEDAHGVTSAALWDCLKTTSLHMQRPELAAFCETYDLDGFRKAFFSEQ